MIDHKDTKHTFHLCLTSMSGKVKTKKDSYTPLEAAKAERKHENASKQAARKP